MSKSIAIIGMSGTGKSTSIRALNPETTFVVSVANKELPFKGSNKLYTTINKNNPKGNLLNSHDNDTILNTLNYINGGRPEINTVIVDDSQYLMAYEFMHRAKENGYNKFTEIAQKHFNLIEYSKTLRDDLLVVFMYHPEVDTDALGNKTIKAKTIGKLLDSAITLEGMFATVLYTEATKNPNGGMQYSFVTQNTGNNTGKSPDGMFDLRMPNDLQLVRDKMIEYYS
jgi:ABC-type glutathione transport system ATPase component